MKATKGNVGRFVEQPDPKVRFYLFLGPDEAQSRVLAARLLEATGASKFALSSADVKGNVAVLVDEAAALSLFGDRRLIWIEPATNDVAEAAEALLAAPSVESPVVAIAGALAKSSALLKLAESSPLAVAFTAYAPEGDDAAVMVADVCRRVGLTASSSVAARIAASCGNDQALVLQELEKLALYIGGTTQSPKPVTEEALDAVGAISSEGDFLQLADLALLGDLDGLAEALARLPAGGAEGVPAIRSLQRRLLLLAPARARVERGERIDSVMTSMGKAFFWKDKDKFARMLRTWSAEELARVAERTGALERNLMFTDVPQREALGEELLAIALRARSAAKAQIGSPLRR